MYRIFADDTLIYDSTLDDYKIGKGQISLEINKSGSFVFSLYPDHFFYDRFVQLKTVITVYKHGKIVFRGRILNDKTDYNNNKVFTCEGELGFLQDSIIRPFEFNGTPEQLFVKLITEHNNQTDKFKQFKIGSVTVIDPNNYIARSNSSYESTLNNLNSRLLEDSTGGYLYITHGADGRDPIPTLNYLADFTNISSQTVEFGSNLKDYTKTVNAEDIATVIIPLGAEVDDGDDKTENKKLTITDVNDGKDYVYSEKGVALYGWIVKTVSWDDVTDARILKNKAQSLVDDSINSNITIELTIIDLHLIDPTIESINICDYIRAVSTPHNFSATLLCGKQTMDLLKPDNDTITLGHTYAGFTESTRKTAVDVNALIKSANSSFSSIKALNDKTAAYMIAEQQLTSLLAQSFGVFQTKEILGDGSSIQYLHDRPKLEDSLTIWKMTANAFAVSTNGGKTWSAGLDSDGNAIVNILSAIGIQASWLDVENLNAISANIGDWKIGESAIYKDITDPGNSNVVYRVILKPHNGIKDGVLMCQKSTDRGNTFSSAFSLNADGSAKFGNFTISADGDLKITGANGSGDDITLTYDVDISEMRMVNKTAGSYSELSPEYFMSGTYDVENDSYTPRAVITNDGTFIGRAVYEATVADAANVFVNTAGYFFRSASSSERYKTDITSDLSDELNPLCLYDLPVKQFKYKPGYLVENDPKNGKDIIGFIVEDLEKIYPSAVTRDSEGKPEMWNANILIPTLLKLIQDLNNRVIELEKSGGDK